MDSWEGAQLNTAKEILAYELTKLVHGEEEAEKAQSSAKAIFSAGDFSDMPEAVITEADLRDGAIDIQQMLIVCGFAASRSEARRTVEGGGASVDGEKITDLSYKLTPDEIGEGRVIRKGKKNYKKLVFK